MKNFELTLYDQNIWGNFSLPQGIGNRNFLIRDIISDCDPDVCCFQEFNRETTGKGEFGLDKLLADKYNELDGIKEPNHATIFYRKDKFDVIKSGYHTYSGMNPGGYKTLTWAVLKERESEILLGIISTHFWYKTKEEIHNLQRLENAKEMLCVVEKIKTEYDIPIFACGDFNCGKYLNSYAPIELIKQNMIEVKDIAEKTTNANTCRVCPKMNEKGIYDVEAYEGIYDIDYVFLSDASKVKLHSYEVDESRRACNSSDHNPLIVKATIY